MITMKKIIQASLEELIDFKLNEVDENSNHGLYTDILIHYLKEDLYNLEQLIKTLPKDLAIYSFASIRLSILKKEIKIDQLMNFEKIIETKSMEDILRGEAYFLLGLSYCEIKKYEKSKIFYSLAQRILSSAGAEKKALKSLFNYIVSESRLNNHKKLILDYIYISKKAKEIGDPITEGLSYLNISQEYSNINAYELSLKYIQLAINLLEKDNGVNHYYFAILQRCQTLIHLNRFQDALLDYQQIQHTDLKAIKAALKVIDVLLDKKRVQNIESRIGPTWYSKLKKIYLNKEEKKLTTKESQIIENLSLGPLSAPQLAEKIYGQNIDHFSSVNRLKVLISRLKKKNSELIIFSEGKYILNDDNLMATL